MKYKHNGLADASTVAFCVDEGWAGIASADSRELRGSPSSFVGDKEPLLPLPPADSVRVCLALRDITAVSDESDFIMARVRLSAHQNHGRLALIPWLVQLAWTEPDPDQ